MNLKLLPIFFLFLSLSACVVMPHISLDERFYGTWVNPLDETEQVIFREDGTVNWFGEEGTFESYEYENQCHPHMIFPCMSGSGEGLKVILPTTTLKIHPNFDTYENAWWLFPNGDTLRPQNSIYGVLLLRAGSFESPIMPAHFTKLGAGWSIPRNRGYKGSTPYFSSYQDHATVRSANPLLAGLKWEHTIYNYNESTDTWESAFESDYGNFHRVGKELIFNKSSRRDETSGAEVDHLRTSFDNGATWNTLPSLGDGNFSDRWDNEFGLAGSVIVEKMNVTPRNDCPEGNCEPNDNQYEIWTIDAASDSPSWVLRSSFTIPHNVYVSPRLYTHPTTGTIAWNAYYNDQNHAQISHDRGVTWQPFDHDCYVPEGTFFPDVLLPHLQGFLCLNQQGNVRWYNSTTHSWTTHTLVRDEFVNHGDPTDGAYIRRGNQVIKWQPDGTETVVTTLSSSLGYGDIYVFDDQVIVNKLGLWRALR